MPKNTGSFIEMPSDKAKELADKALNRIFAGREQGLKDHVQFVQRQLNQKWWRRFLGLTPLTYDQVLARERILEPWLNEVDRIVRWWSDDEAIALRVRLGAAHSASVWLSLFDLKVLAGGVDRL